jgi:chromosome segregation ATPase
MEVSTSEGNRADLERRNAELERRLHDAREQLDAAREALDRLAAEQSEALAALHKAERRRGSLAYRLAAELRARLGGSR